MPRRKPKILTRDEKLRAAAIYARSYPGLTGWQWAWGFLSRNEKYLDAYRTFAALAPHVQQAINDPTLGFPSDTPVDCLDLWPVPKGATTYAEWGIEVARKRASGTSREDKADEKALEAASKRKRENAPPGKICLQPDRTKEIGTSAGFHEKFDSEVRFGLRQWLDPTIAEVEVRVNPFVRAPVPVVFASRFAEAELGPTIEQAALSFEWEFEFSSDAVAVFDTALPIDEQLEDARVQLEAFAERFHAAKRQSPPQNQVSGTDEAILLKILDLQSLGLTDRQMIKYLPSVPRTGNLPDANWVKSRRHAAERRRDYGYRFLAFR